MIIDHALLLAASATFLPAGTAFSCNATRVWDGDGPVWCERGPKLRLAGIGVRELDKDFKGETD